MEMSEDRSTMAPGSSANGAPLIDQAKHQAGQVVQKTRDAAGRVADQAFQQVKTQVETGKERATGSLEGVAQALHATGETLVARNQEMIGGVAETGAELVEQVSEYFRQRSVNEIAADVEGFARRQSVLFLGGSFALGFLLSRFLKSTSPTHPMGGSDLGPRNVGYGAGAGTIQSASSSFGREVAPTPTALPPSSPQHVAPATAGVPAWVAAGSTSAAAAKPSPTPTVANADKSVPTASAGAKKDVR